MSAGLWAFWLAAAALIAGAGKFLDDYHIKARTKSKIRDVLINLFVWLDKQSVPDLGGFILSYIKRLLSMRGLGMSMVAILLACWAILSTFYLGREFIGPPNIESYLFYLVNWIPRDRTALIWIGFLVAILVPAFLGLIVMARYFHSASMSDSDRRRIFFLVVGILLGLSIALLGTGISLGISMVAIEGGGYFLPLIVAASLASLALPSLLALSTIALVLFRWILKFIQFILLEIFDAASSPSISPFTYASSLLSLIVLGAKVIQVTVTG